MLQGAEAFRRRVSRNTVSSAGFSVCDSYNRSLANALTLGVNCSECLKWHIGKLPFLLERFIPCLVFSLGNILGYLKLAWLRNRAVIKAAVLLLHPGTSSSCHAGTLLAVVAPLQFVLIPGIVLAQLFAGQRSEWDQPEAKKGVGEESLGSCFLPLPQEQFADWLWRGMLAQHVGGPCGCRSD